ncbi:MAG: glycosyltransferase [Thermodesulfobacteriota bacterium]
MSGEAQPSLAEAKRLARRPLVPPLRIPPDTYSRNWWISRLCRKAFEPGERFTVLDVGGSGGLLGEFLRDVRVVDLRSGADVDAVADARHLPFDARSFDVVCCADVLEHVDEADRGLVLSELFRVAREVVIVAGPYRSPQIELAEEALRDFHRHSTNGLAHGWLEEHLQHGLPPLAWLEDWIGASGRTFRRLATNDVGNWLLVQMLIFLNMFDLDAQVGDFFEDYNRGLTTYRDVSSAPYRHIHAIPLAARRDAGLEAVEHENQSLAARGSAYGPPPALVARVFAAVGDAMAAKNTRSEATVASAARRMVVLGGADRPSRGDERGRPQLTHEEALARCADLEERLRLAREAIEGHEAFIHQQHQQIEQVRAVLDSVLRSKSWKITAPLRSLVESARQLTDVPRRLVGLEPRRRGGGAGGEARKAVLFLSGCPGDAKRYRCDHHAEQMQVLGVTADVAIYGEIDLAWALRTYAYFVLHRVPFGPDVDHFIREARRTGRTVVFDTDDWVFDVSSMPYVAALEGKPREERDLYRRGLERYRATLRRCDGAIVSTEPLARRASSLIGKVVVHANVASRDMVQLAAQARRVRELRRQASRSAGEVVIAYLSGTPTHRRDFAEAEAAIVSVMERHPGVRLLTVGHIDVSETFGRFGQRHAHLPLMPWQRLFALMAQVDVNLAPLEQGNPFTECKSSIKFLEAALVGVPTVASALSDFERVIDDGSNGVLVRTREGWRDALSRLVESPGEREALGARALEDALARHRTATAAPALLDTLKSLRSRTATSRPLMINWIVRAPIAGTGGGYWTIFRLANHLGAAGHQVRVYVEPIAHLDGLSEAEILAFLDENFGPLHVEPVIGHEHILPADVSIATNWPTAYTVERLQDSLFKMYFVQDFEPEFYETRDPLYRKAEATYDLPLQIVTIGRSLARRMEEATGRPALSIDFAVDAATFRLERDPAERGEPVRVLFFARPSLPRRGFPLGVEALRRVKQARPGVQIAFFGAGADELREVDFELENLGVLSHAELARAMNASHVLLCFSLSANISWVPLQGMACGCAVVDADVPGVREMIADGETCRLAAPEPESVAQAVIALIDDAAARERLGRAAAAEMQRRTWEGSAEQFERIVEDRCFVRLDWTRGEARAARGQGRAAVHTGA